MFLLTDSSKNFSAEIRIVLIFLCAAPLLSVLVKGWVSSCFILALLVCIYAVIKENSKDRYCQFRNFFKKNRLNWLILFPLALPFFVVLFSSLINDSFILRNFDGPSRYLLSIIILFVLSYQRFSIKNMVINVIALTPLLTLIFINFIEKKDWSNSERLTIYFIDPLVFGSICLTFSALSLVIFLSKNIQRYQKILSLFGLISGFYLSIESESRTGWLGFPVVIMFLLIYRTKLNMFIIAFCAIAITFFAGLTLYKTSSIFEKRLDAFVSDILEYKWNEININTSAGERISYIRMGWYYMTLRPLSGWEGLDFLAHKDDVSIASHASPEIRIGVKYGGFHNEYINSAVKYGLPGLLYSLFLVFLPAIFFIKSLSINRESLPALTGLSLTSMYAISCLSYQVLDFKFTITLYAILLVLLVTATNEDSK